MVIEESIIINASLTKVWDTFTDLTCWADWNTVFKDLSSDRVCMEEGGTFRCCLRPYAFPIYIEPRIEEVMPMEKIVWTGEKYAISSRHEFLFTEHPYGVKVVSREEFTGMPLAVTDVLFPEKKVREMTVRLLEELRDAAEF